MSTITMEILVCVGVQSMRETAVVMSEREFTEIENTKDTPSFVVVGDTLYHNTYTCWSGFDGTCNCVSHPRKEWVESPLKEHSFRGFSELVCPRCKKGTNFFIKSSLPRYAAGQCCNCNWEDLMKKPTAFNT